MMIDTKQLIQQIIDDGITPDQISDLHTRLLDNEQRAELVQPMYRTFWQAPALLTRYHVSMYMTARSDWLEGDYDLYMQTLRLAPEKFNGLRLAHMGGNEMWFIMLAGDALRFLTPDQWDFITDRKTMLKPTPPDQLEAKKQLDRDFDEVLKRSKGVSMYDLDTARLIDAFCNSLNAEAKPFEHRVLTGAFVLDVPPIVQDINFATRYPFKEIRVLAYPQGLLISIIGQYAFTMPALFWYAPDFSTAWLLGSDATAPLLLGAALWRDLCVVREQTITQPRYHGRGRRKAGGNSTQQNTIVLPRKIYRYAWGSQSDREAIAIRRKHGVRGHYRILTDGHNASDSAIQAAYDCDYPLPPKGFTFVRPHIRGAGTDYQPTTTRIVCTGLNTLNVTLAQFADRLEG